MKEKKLIWVLLGCAVIIGAVAAIFFGMKGKKAADEENVITAMYVPYGEGFHIFVSEEIGAFVVTADKETLEVKNAGGQKISFDQLAKGNVVKIYGNGAMAESYPGQYPGVSRIEVVKEGSPSDADQYQGIIDEIYSEPDPSEPPTMQVEYTTELANAVVFINRGGYEWVYMDKDGLSNAVVADSTPVLDWGDLLADIVLSEPTDLILSFTEKPQEVEAVRYDSSLLGKGSEMPEGEKAVVAEKDGQLVMEGVEGGYVYEITAVWENGRATFGFITVKR